MKIKKAVDEWIKIIEYDDNNLKYYIHYKNLGKNGFLMEIGEKFTLKMSELV